MGSSDNDGVKEYTGRDLVKPNPLTRLLNQYHLNAHDWSNLINAPYTRTMQ